MSTPRRLLGDRLTAAHPHPVHEPVDVVDEKDRKADDDGERGKIVHGGERPEDDEHDIVGGIAERVEGTAARREIDGNKTGRHGNGARDEVGGMERLQNKVEGDGHGGGDSYIMKELFETMSKGVPPKCSGGEGLRSAVFALALDRAAQTGELVDLEPIWDSLGE